MAFKALLTTALVAASRANSPPQQEVEEDDGRLFISGTGNPNQSIVIGNSSLVFVGLLVACLVVALVAAAFVGRPRDLGGLKSSYAPPASYESSYAVHRALEETAKKHQ